MKFRSVRILRSECRVPADECAWGAPFTAAALGSGPASIPCHQPSRIDSLKTHPSLREFESRRVSVENFGLALRESQPTAAHLGDEPDVETHNGSMVQLLMEIAMKTSNPARINTLVSILATGALLWGIALPAQAADATYGVRTKKVSLSDLDLSTIAGQETARERLHQVAHRLCAQVEDLNDLSHHANYMACVEQATAKALPHLDAMIRRATDIRTASVGQVQR
jgi:UrcA family protein